jgi:4'-phosphopantetheinyl transferase
VNTPLEERQLHVWLLDGPAAQSALRSVLLRYTTAPLEFAVRDHGKPYLPAAPRLEFNLSHSHGRAIVSVALDVAVGADIERIRPMPDCLAVAGRFFPPAEAEALLSTSADRRETEFFRRWTRIEAMLKARGVGLLGAGAPLDGDWTVETIDAGPGFAAAVAAEHPGMHIVIQR